MVQIVYSVPSAFYWCIKSWGCLDIDFLDWCWISISFWDDIYPLQIPKTPTPQQAGRAGRSDYSKWRLPCPYHKYFQSGWFWSDVRKTGSLFRAGCRGDWVGNQLRAIISNDLKAIMKRYFWKHIKPKSIYTSLYPFRFDLHLHSCMR